MLQVKEPAWRHFAADFSCKSTAMLNDAEWLTRWLRRSLNALSTDCIWLYHRFEPQGLSVVALASSIRVAVHTWPERRRATIDVWTADFDATAALESCGRELAESAPSA